MKEDSGRGYRIYVPSPNPKRIVEIESIKALFENNVIPIACGGGGIPVVEKNGEYEGIDAVYLLFFTLHLKLQIFNFFYKYSLLNIFKYFLLKKGYW